MRLRFWRNHERELEDEIQSHLRMAIEEQLESGMTAREAEASARREFGNIGLVKEVTRDVWGWRWIDSARWDARYALRQLRRSPGFTAAVVLSLAGGIGFSVAVFAAIEALLLSPFSYRDADRMTVPTVYFKSGGQNDLFLTGSQFAQLQQATVVDDAMAVDFFPMVGEIKGAGAALYVRGARVSLNAFDYWGVAPLVGRTFTPADIQNGAPNRVAVLAYPYWQSRFGGDRGAVGQSIRLDTHMYEIIGVMPQGFLGTYWGTELYLPTEYLGKPNYPHAIRLRLKPGVSHAEGTDALQPLFAAFAAESPRQLPRESRVRLDRIDAVFHLRFGNTLNVLFAAAALLLMIGCANAAILFLSHATTRHDELRVRRALGAASSRIVGQLLAEAGCLALAGAVAGLLIAQLGVRLIRQLAPETFFPPELEFHINSTVLVFSVALATVATLLFGLWPAIRSAMSTKHVLTLNAARTTESVRHRRAYNMLTVAQVAVTLVILASAAAALQSFVRLLGRPLGYEPRPVLRIAVTVAEGQYATRPNRIAHYERIRARVAEVPSVRSVSIGMGAALVPPNTGYRMPVEWADRAFAEPQSVLSHLVDERYPEALGLSVNQGRWWSNSETVRATPVLVINEAMAARYWPDRNPVGERVRLPNLTSENSWNLPAANATDWLEVIGVVRNAPNVGLREPPQPGLYAPYTLFVQDLAGMVIRTNGGSLDATTDAIRRAVDDAVPGTPIVAKSAMALLEDIGWGRERFLSTIFGLIAAIALVIGAIGIFSVVAYVVTRRTRELGIRAALGATPGSLIRMLLRSAFAAVSAGVVLGIALSVALSGAVNALAGVVIQEPRVLLLAAAILLAVAVLAMLLPARHATKVDPLVALRYK